MAIRLGTTVTTPIYQGLADEVEVFGYVLEECEHGLRADLCQGPNHYGEDNPWDEPPF